MALSLGVGLAYWMGGLAVATVYISVVIAIHETISFMISRHE